MGAVTAGVKDGAAEGVASSKVKKVQTSRVAATDVVKNGAATVLKRPAAGEAVDEEEGEDEAVNIPVRAKKLQTSRGAAAEVVKTGTATVLKRPAAGGGVDEEDEEVVKIPVRALFGADDRVKVVKGLNLGLKLSIGETYSFGELCNRCKGKADKLEKLASFSHDELYIVGV